MRFYNHYQWFSRAMDKGRVETHAIFHNARIIHPASSLLPPRMLCQCAVPLSCALLPRKDWSATAAKSLVPVASIYWHETLNRPGRRLCYQIMEVLQSVGICPERSSGILPICGVKVMRLKSPSNSQRSIQSGCTLALLNHGARADCSEKDEEGKTGAHG